VVIAGEFYVQKQEGLLDEEREKVVLRKLVHDAQV
jgi:hypothetical protein